MFVVVGVFFWGGGEGLGGWLKDGDGVQLHQPLWNSCIFISNLFCVSPLFVLHLALMLSFFANSVLDNCFC